MSRREIEDYFGKIAVWMQNDIRREIRLAQAARGKHRELLASLGIIGAGNLLAALGLLAYSEALGRIRYWNTFGRHGKPEECFLSFIDEMREGAYGAWRIDWEAKHTETSLYETLRCGLAHEYQPKIHAAVYIAEGGDSLGLGEDERGRLIFRVAPYFDDFGTEITRLRRELGDQDASIPPPYFKRMSRNARESFTIQPSS